MASFVTDSLLGEEQTPSTSQQGVPASPTATKAYNDYLERGQGVVDTTAPFAATPLNQYNEAGIDGYYNGGSSFDFGKQANSAYGQAANFNNQAGVYAGMAGSPITSGQIQSSYADFMNPYEQQVAGNVEDAYSRMIDSKLSDSRARAGGALGNSRTGIEAGSIISQGTREMGDALDSIYSNGYNTSMSYGMDRLNNDRNAAANAASVYGNLGASSGQLGNGLINARFGMEDMRTNRLGTEMGIGDVYRNIDTQNNQVPLQQLSVYQSLFNPLSGAGTSTGGTAATAGLFGSGGTFNAGGNLYQQAAQAAGAGGGF